MDKSKISPISLTWDELEQQLFTPEEIAEGKSNLKLSMVLKILNGLGYELQIVKKPSKIRETLNEQLKNPEFKKRMGFNTTGIRKHPGRMRKNLRCKGKQRTYHNGMFFFCTQN